MNALDKQKITDLRIRGEGYKAIAAALGLSRDSVRSYCKRNGLDGDSALVALNVDEQIKLHRLCTCCKSPIKQKSQGRTRRFCSEGCRRTWWSQHPEQRARKDTSCYRFTCPHCTKTFTSYGNKERKFCSHTCYIQSRFWGENDGISETAYR